MTSPYSQTHVVSSASSLVPFQQGDLMSNLNRWNDNAKRLSSLSHQMQELREEQRKLQEKILLQMHEGNLQNHTIQLMDGKRISVVTRQHYGAYTAKYLAENLGKMVDEESARLMMQYLKANRPVRSIQELTIT